MSQLVSDARQLALIFLQNRRYIFIKSVNRLRCTADAFVSCTQVLKDIFIFFRLLFQISDHVFGHLAGMRSIQLLQLFYHFSIDIKKIVYVIKRCINGAAHILNFMIQISQTDTQLNSQIPQCVLSQTERMIQGKRKFGCTFSYIFKRFLTLFQGCRSVF